MTGGGLLGPGPPQLNLADVIKQWGKYHTAHRARYSEVLYSSILQCLLGKRSCCYRRLARDIRNGPRRRPYHTPKCLLTLHSQEKFFLIMLTFSPLRSCMALHCYLFLRRKNMIMIKIFITRWPRGKKASSLASSGSCTFKFDMFEHLYLLSMPGH